jgi:hypothetical protein
VTSKPESYRIVRRIGTYKRACSHAFPGIHLILELSRYADISGVEMFCATPKFWSSGEGFPTGKRERSITLCCNARRVISRMTDSVNCSAFADSFDLTAAAGAGFAGSIFDAIQSAIDIGVARYDLNVLAGLRERD